MQMVSAKGVSIPVIGLGTWPMRGSACQETVETALALGYRHVDTAQMYENEAEVGAGIRASGLPRDAVFLTTKVLPELTSAAKMPKSVEESLRKLKVDSVDLLLAHWPYPSIPVRETVETLSELKRRGLARNIGVSNYTVKLHDEAVAASPEPLIVNQIEYHPFVDQTKVLDAVRRHGMAVTAYSPVARGRVIGNPVIEKIAAAHGKSATQVSLRWLVQQDVIVIPKSTHPERLKANLDIFDFVLSDREMAEIDALGGNSHIVNAPDRVPQWD